MIEDLKNNNTCDDKFKNLIKYLKEIISLQTKVIRTIDEYEDFLWLQDIPNGKGFSIIGRDSEDIESDLWIEFRDFPPPKMPVVPRICEKWVDEKSLKNTEILPKLKKSIQIVDKENEEIQTLFLKDNLKAKEMWDKYLNDKWIPWKKDYIKWKEKNDIYKKVYSFYRKIKNYSEDYELVIGFGFLILKEESHPLVKRHLLTAKVDIEFNEELGKITISPSFKAKDFLGLEVDMLESKYRFRVDEEKVKKSLERCENNPWNKECINKVFQMIANSLGGGRCRYYDNFSIEKRDFNDDLVIQYAPALILRKRSNKGLIKILSQMEKENIYIYNLPNIFKDLIECFSLKDFPRNKPEIDTDYNVDNFSNELFFPKPYNDEQKQIAEKLEFSNGVVVQGPPGTGKSHTIANLISHFLAKGKKILVTAKTVRALKALQQLIPNEIKPLCITYLGNTKEELRDFESSINGILKKHRMWNKKEVQNEIEELTQQLYELRKEQSALNREIIAIRESETKPVELFQKKYFGTPAQIAKKLIQEKEIYSWFKDEVSKNDNYPFENENPLDFIYKVRYFNKEKQEELKKTVPKNLPSIEIFEQFCVFNQQHQFEKLTEFSTDEKRILDSLSNKDYEVLNDFKQILEKLLKKIKDIQDDRFPWIDEAIRDVFDSKILSWNKLAMETKKILSKLASISFYKNNDNNQLNIPDNLDCKLALQSVTQLIEYLKEGKTIKWYDYKPPSIKQNLKIVKKIKINNKKCKSLEDFMLLKDLLTLKIELEKAYDIWSSWENINISTQSFQIKKLEILSDKLEAILSLTEYFKKINEWVNEELFLTKDYFFDVKKLSTLIRLLEAAIVQSKSNFIRKIVNRLSIELYELSLNKNSHPICEDLRNAIQNTDFLEYQRCYKKIEELKNEKLEFENLRKKIRNLEKQIPLLLKDFLQDTENSIWVDRFKNLKNAWEWAQAQCIIKDFLNKNKLADLSERVNQIDSSIRSIIEKLASLYSWEFCFERLNDEHWPHMEAWKLAIKRLGKSSKYASRYKLEAQKHLKECQDAIPAWVMPLHKIWDTFESGIKFFDLLIIDEASQCGIEGIPLFLFAQKILVVGDDKQISPEFVGINRETVHFLQDKYLSNFKFKDTFNLETSIFDHAILRFKNKIVLREHFRCMPEIIRYSNEMCYNDTPLIPLRQYGRDRLEPPLKSVFVNTGYREGKGNYVINRPEAEALVNKIVELCQLDRYKGKSMGVISLQGNAQAKLIERMLLEKIGASEIEKRGLLCGNPYSFQGDERDVIFLSMVAAPNERIGTLSKRTDMQRFNVAMSRARDQVWLFHSVTLEDLSDSDYRKSLLEFFLNSKPKKIGNILVEELEKQAKESNRNIIKPPEPFDSWFEVDVALELLRRNYYVIPQFKVAGKRIDLVIEGRMSKLAVECDGDYWHGADQYEDDMRRQRQLERCGWTFVRVRESEFYIDKPKMIEKIVNKCNELNIFPLNFSLQKEPVEGIENKSPKNKIENGKIGNKPKRDSTTKEPNIDFPIEKNYWFALSKWGKETNLLNPKERKFAYDVGRFLANKRELTMKMKKWAQSIYLKSKKLGFKEKQ